MLPIYRPRLDDEVLATVDRSIALLQHGDWYLVAPMSLETSFYEKRYGKAIVRFPDACFDSGKTTVVFCSLTSFMRRLPNTSTCW